MTRLLFGLVLFVQACTDTHGGDDAGMGLDGGSGIDAGRDPVSCGPTLCALGQVCCNESCGICTAPGEGCTAMECAPDAGMTTEDAGVTSCVLDEDCGAGRVCCPGCDDEMFCSDGDLCPEIACPIGCLADGTACGAGEYCDYEPGSDCGGVGACVPIPTVECPPDCPGVCGCDFNDYCSACAAAAAGVDVWVEVPCERIGCEPMDARSEGDCEVLVGYAWDGTDCTPINCACAGIDCDWIYESRELCIDDYFWCTGPSCGGFTGEACGSGEFCDYRDLDMCGAADASGVCRTLPSSCDGEPISPVCGCDGNTYDNDCLAHVAGTDAMARGACGADCRTAGCGDPSLTCTACRVGEYRCLAPDEFCAF